MATLLKPNDYQREQKKDEGGHWSPALLKLSDLDTNTKAQKSKRIRTLSIMTKAIAFLLSICLICLFCAFNAGDDLGQWSPWMRLGVVTLVAAIIAHGRFVAIWDAEGIEDRSDDN